VEDFVLNRASLLLVGLCLTLGIASADTGLIYTVAGNGSVGLGGVGGPATSANLDAPGCTVRDPSGNLFIADVGHGYVYRVDASTKIITIVAGDGLTYLEAGGGPGVPPSTVPVQSFCVVLDQANNIYTTDGHHNRILRTDAVTGVVTTVAGNGSSLSSGDGGLAIDAGINGPAWLAIDSQGNLFVAEQLAHKIRRIDAVTGIITTVAGSGVAGFSGDGGSAIAASLNNPWAVSLDAGGSLYISEYSNLRVRRVDAATGIITTVAGTGATYAFNGDGQQATAANVYPFGTAVDVQGNLFIASWDRIRRVDAVSGMISTVAGWGGTLGSLTDGVHATAANLYGVMGVTVLPNGHLLASVVLNPRVREIYYPAPEPYTATTVTSNNPAAIEGQPVMLTATVVPAPSGAEFGYVFFYDSSTGLGNASVVNGTASLTVSNLTAGTHTIYVLYGAFSNGVELGVSSSPVIVQTVKRGTNVNVSSTPNPATPNQTVSFTITLSPTSGSAVPPISGTVQLMDGSTVLGTATVNNGVAAIPAAFAVTGTHSITAVYSGDGNYPGRTSSAYSQSVQNAATVNVAVTPASPVLGQSTTITATVSPSTATGTVQFIIDGMLVGTATLSGGIASVSTTWSSSGLHYVTANYLGDASNQYAPGTITVTWKNATSISLAAQPVSPVAGQPATISATLSPSSTTGTVQFLDGITVLGTGTVSGGVASSSTSILTAGSHTLTANYSGDASNAAVSGSISATVKNAATISLAVSPVSLVTGQSATITASVSPSSVTGTVQFLDGSTVLGTGTLSGAVASLSTSALVAGLHILTANYSGDALNAAVSGSVSATVKNAATIGVAVQPAAPVAGQPATISAAVLPSSATGTVQFLDGATVLGSGAVSGGVASLSTSALVAGLHTLTASYSGDALNLPVSGSISATVKNAAAVALVVLPASPIAGQSATLSAAVSPSSATGSVQFLDGASVIGTGALSGGVASLSTSALVVGSHTLTAVYSGDALNLSGSGSVSVAVKGVTTTSLTLGNPQSPALSGVMFTAQVSPAAATGSVQFLDSGVLLGTVSVSGGSAALIVNSLAVGTHPIQAIYLGSAAYVGSSSAVGNQIIVKAASAVALSSTPNPSVYLQAVTVTAMVSSGLATGSVQFFDNGSLVGTVALNGVTAMFASSSLGVGSHSLTAAYSGDANFLSASSPGVVQTVNKASTSTSLSTNLNPAAKVQTVTFTAAVTASAATGQVEFLKGTSVMATVNLSNGVARYSTSSLSVGSNSITAKYLGDSKFLTSTSAVLVETITSH
jgi:large repetitive protein